MSHVRSGGYIKAGRLGEEAKDIDESLKRKSTQDTYNPDAHAQRIADKITSGNNSDKLHSKAYDSTIYRHIDRHFEKNKLPEKIYNRVASRVFQKLDDTGRRLTTDPRLNQESSLDEARVDHREFATAGIMHPDMAHAPRMKAGNYTDFYSRKNGDKLHGKILSNDHKTVRIEHEGKVHKFDVRRSIPKSMYEELSDRELRMSRKMSHGKTLAKEIMAKQSTHPISQNMGEEVEQIEEAKDIDQDTYDPDAHAQRIADKITSGNNLDKLHNIQHDTAIYRHIEHHFEKNKLPGKIFGRVATKVFKKLDDTGRTSMYNEEKDEHEYGYEGDMAMSQLKSIIANAQRLYDMLEPETDLPEWVQSKITLAEDYIVTATNYCAGELDEEVVVEGSEGKTPETETEVNLAKKSGDPNKITYGDVIKARIQSAKNKALKKGD